MRTAFALLIASALVAVAVPLSALAHAGVEKQAGNTTVYLKQFPLSPFVGENVQFYFGLNSRVNGVPLAGKSVALRVVDTYYGDESRDKIVHEKRFVTDANGNFTFQYAFGKENHFDVELSIDDPVTKGRETTGFLVQARNGTSAPAQRFDIAVPRSETGLASIFLRWFAVR